MSTNPPVEILTMVILLFFWFTKPTKANPNDMQALIDLKSQFSLPPNHTLSLTWKSSSSFCNWTGVSCSSRHNRVSALNLSFMDLQGTLSPSIGNLSFLTLLDLQNNSLQGQLPGTLGHLRRLRVMDVRFNQLGGNIPTEIANLSNLEIIYLRKNHFIGNFLPLMINMSRLWLVNAMENNFTGIIPDEICRKLPKLQILDLSKNNLVGQVPASLTECEGLREIALLGNGFSGSIPAELGSISTLEYLNLGENELTGTIPPSLGNLSRLSFLDLGRNPLSGEIPQELTRLYAMVQLRIDFNTNLVGTIPSSIFNLSSAQLISFMMNNLTGSIPEFNSRGSLQLRTLFLSRNNLEGGIPLTILNASQLTILELSGNSLSGQVPSSLGNLRLLETLNIQFNQLTGDPSQRTLHFLTSLSNCRNLKNLVVGSNPLNGELPGSLGNLSSSLQLLYLFSSQIKGSIPSSIGNLSSVLNLMSGENNLTGTIPSSIGNLRSLQRLQLFRNNLEGRIPNELCALNSLGELLANENHFGGPIPDCIGNLGSLQILGLGSNALESIPRGLWSLSSLWALNLSHNSIDTSVPRDIEKLTNLEGLDLSNNRISGDIPTSISSLVMLRQIYLSNNSFEGSVLESINKLTSLEELDLSSNNFSGAIPKTMENLTSLRYLNLSYNDFWGEIPSEGIFKNFTAQSFLGNTDLCSSTLQGFSACPSSGDPQWKKPSFWLRYILPPAVIVLLVAILYTLRFGKGKQSPSVGISDIVNQRFITYSDLVHATNNFNEENLLGAGSHGSVYKGTMGDGEMIAVKVFNMETDNARKSFDRECDVLRNVRHRNLLKIISSCSNLDFRSLVFPLMPQGSLEKLLYSQQPLNFLSRLNIMIDVAVAIEYLHHGYSEPVVHCDLKPSNVLLDEDMVAHVGDFGIAKILANGKSLTQTGTLGTIGYVAPEYGVGGKMWTKGDVYSYGIMLMEIFIRKRPTDEMFGRGQSMRQWVMNFPQQAVEVFYADAFEAENTQDQHHHQKMQLGLSSIMELGVLCSSDSHEQRPNMDVVVATLTNIKRRYLLPHY